VVARGVLPTAPPRAGRLRQQLAFALPFAGATWLYVGQRYFAQYAVSARFAPAVFALYTVASFHLPVVDIVFTPITEVMMVELGRAFARAEPGAARTHFFDAVDKLAAILFPAACGAWLLGPAILPLLFTHKYTGAVPLFLLATFEIPLWILPVDALLRAAGDTRFLFAFNAARVFITAGLVLAGIRLLGLPGALAGSIASEALARAAMLMRGRRLLGPRLFDWPVLGRSAAAAALACLPAQATRVLPMPAPLGIALAIATYGATYVALRVALVRRAPALTAEGAAP
jgi:O-antigen/teichoic acid export membrane protein